MRMATARTATMTASAIPATDPATFPDAKLKHKPRRRQESLSLSPDIRGIG